MPVANKYGTDLLKPGALKEGYANHSKYGLSRKVRSATNCKNTLICISPPWQLDGSLLFSQWSTVASVCSLVTLICSNVALLVGRFLPLIFALQSDKCSTLAGAHAMHGIACPFRFQCSRQMSTALQLHAR